MENIKLEMHVLTSLGSSYDFHYAYLTTEYFKESDQVILLNISSLIWTELRMRYLDPNYIYFLKKRRSYVQMFLINTAS